MRHRTPKRRTDPTNRAIRFLDWLGIRTPADWADIRDRFATSNDRHDKITLRVGDQKYMEGTSE